MKLWIIYEPHKSHYSPKLGYFAEVRLAVARDIDELMEVTGAMEVDNQGGMENGAEFWGIWTPAETLQAVELI